MMAVLCALLSIDVALSTLLYDDHGLVGTSWSIMMSCLVDYVKYDQIYIYAGNVKVWCCLVIMLDYDWHRLVVLELMHDCSYLTTWVYNGYIYDVVAMYTVI